MTHTAWSLIGFDGDGAQVRIKGGRTLYEAVTYYDHTPGTMVKLSRLEVRADGPHQIDRWVHPDTELEIVPDEQETA